MRPLPFADPGRPDTRSSTRLLLWVARRQLRTLVEGVLAGVVWMLAQALLPYALGRAVDDGLTQRHTGALFLWAGALLGLGVVQAAFGILRHRFAISNWLQASFRLIQVVTRHLARTGPAVRGEITTGEVVATVSNDALRAGGAFDITARLSGAVVAYVVVAVLLLSTSVVLGLVVLIGVPVLAASLSFVIRPLQQRQREQRDEIGQLTALGADTVAGLRVLRGIGGEEVFLGRYRRRSQEVRRAGVRVAVPQSTLDSAQVLLPGIFVVIVTWLGARFALEGRIKPGELVAFYGYAAFLVIPLRTAAEAVDKITRAYVGTRRILAILAVEPRMPAGTDAAASPAPGAQLVDAASGVALGPGQLTALVPTLPDEAAPIVDRLGGFTRADGVTLGGVPLDELALAEVRRRIVVSETDPLLFSGTLRSELDPWGRATDEQILEAIGVADAEDVLEALPGGLDGEVGERGRGFSGGQRQRLVLARALLSDPETLILFEPTSAVDAHTEARIAERLHAARAGRTTAVVTTSPLVLGRADRVVLLEQGRVVTAGTHKGLLRSSRAYRETVMRAAGE